MAGESGEAKRPPADCEAERAHTLTNILMLVFFVGIVAAGIWIANVMLDVRKAQDCVASGRRNCAPIDVPIRQH